MNFSSIRPSILSLPWEEALSLVRERRESRKTYKAPLKRAKKVSKKKTSNAVKAIDLMTEEELLTLLAKIEEKSK